MPWVSPELMSQIKVERTQASSMTQRLGNFTRNESTSFQLSRKHHVFHNHGTSKSLQINLSSTPS